MGEANDGDRADATNEVPPILSAGAAHDLANLIAVIGGTAALLADQSRNDPSPFAQAVREHANRIGSCVEKASDLIERLPGRALKSAPPHTETFDLRLAIDEALDLTQPLVPRGVLDTDKLPGPPLPVDGAPLDAIQLVLNLVLNARDAVDDRPDPRVMIRCQTVIPPLHPRPLVGALTSGRSYACLTVTDTGSGVDIDALAKRLDAQARSDGSDVSALGIPGLDVPGLGTTDGRGWGLRIVADIVRRSCGALRARSSAAGTTFEVFWPLAHPSDVPDLTGRVVLLIAGVPSRTAAFANAFEAAGAEVALCLDAEDALRSASEDRGEWDLVLLSGNGRHHQAWSVAERMREADATLPLLLADRDTTRNQRAPDGFTVALPLDARPIELLRVAMRIMPLVTKGTDRCAS